MLTTYKSCIKVYTDLIGATDLEIGGGSVVTRPRIRVYEPQAVKANLNMP